MVHNGLGLTLSKMGKLDQAIEHYKKALVLDPKYAEASTYLGIALDLNKSVDEAITHLESAIEMDPEYVPAHDNLGILLARTGQSDKAIVHLKKAVEARPSSADARRNLGHALLDNGDLRDAGHHLEEALKLTKGRDALALHLLGRVYAGFGRIDDDIRLQQQAFSIAEQQKNIAVVQLISKHMTALGLKQ